MTEREEQTECSKQLECACSAPRVLIDEYLDYLRTLNHSAHTMKAYGNDLMSFAHWCSEMLLLISRLGAIWARSIEKGVRAEQPTGIFLRSKGSINGS